MNDVNEYAFYDNQYIPVLGKLFDVGRSEVGDVFLRHVDGYGDAQRPQHFVDPGTRTYDDTSAPECAR